MFCSHCLNTSAIVLIAVVHQMLEDGRYSPKVDVYSFGILLGEVGLDVILLFCW